MTFDAAHLTMNSYLFKIFIYSNKNKEAKVEVVFVNLSYYKIYMARKNVLMLWSLDGIHIYVSKKITSDCILE